MKNDTIQFAVKVFPRILFSRMALAIAALIAIAGCASSQAQQAPQLQNFHNRGVGVIPNSRYWAHFGPQHTFHLSPATYAHDHRFERAGYSFAFVDEWPTNWLASEDIFIVQIEGAYYLCNRTYPGVTIPLSIATSRDASIPVKTKPGAQGYRA